MNSGNVVELMSPYKRLNSKNRYTIVTGGRGGGKSFHVAAFLLMLTYSPNEVILFTRYTLVSAQISIIPEFIQKMELWGNERDFIIKNDEIINRHTNSRILFRGIKTSAGNQTANLKSIQGLTCWVLDEAEELVNEEEFDKIDLSIRTKGATNRIVLVLNPSHVEHWIYKRFFEGGEVAGVTYIHTTYLDNLKNLDTSFVNIAERLKQDNPEKYRHVYLGQWGTVADSVFSEGYSIYEGDIESYDYRIYGGDFGFVNDPCVMIEVTKDGRNLYLKERIWEQGLTNRNLIFKIQELGLHQEQSIWDSAENKSIAEMRIGFVQDNVQYSINATPAIKGADSVFFGLQKLRNFIIHIHKDSKNLQSEFTNYRWKKMSDGTYARNSKGHLVPDDKNNHGIDATRYAVTRFAGWD